METINWTAEEINKLEIIHDKYMIKLDDQSYGLINDCYTEASRGYMGFGTLM